MKTRLALLAVAPLLLAIGAIGCSSAEAEDDPGDADEGALEGDKVLGILLGEASRGDTLGKDFVTKSASEKQAIAWSKATAPGELRCHLTESSLSGEALVQALGRCKQGTGADDLVVPSIPKTLGTATWAAFVGILGGSGLLKPAFSPSGDEAPALRKKVIHSFGSVAKVELRIDSHSQYTGILAPPKDGEEFTRVRGLARYSSGGPEKLLGFLPGAGVKFFTSGGESVDLHILPPKPADGTPEAEAEKAHPNYNVLAYPFSNEFAKAGPQGTVEKIFAKVHPTPLFLPIDHMGMRTVDGEVVANSKAPKHLSYDPDPATSGAIDAYLRAHPGVDYRVALADATKDATEDKPVKLYTVRVGLIGAKKPANVDAEYPAIGEFVATSPFVPSKWADRQLYTRHNRGCTPVIDGAQTNEAPSLCPSSR